MAGAKMGLGGGLSNLFGSDTSDLMEESLDNGTKNLPLAKIEPNPDQPRKVFEQGALDELAARVASETGCNIRLRCAARRKTAIIRSSQASAAGVLPVRQGWRIFRQ